LKQKYRPALGHSPKSERLRLARGYKDSGGYDCS